jgi:glycosyltransferase involved in cell wall biosynthesis
MRIDVVICTWNRCRLLVPTLERLREIDIPQNVDWQVIVVDNNCTDNTAATLQSFAEHLPLRTLFEPRPGLSNARNRAVAEATGDYLVWTDDDVLVDRRWLAAYAQAFERWPTAAFFGGPIEPWFEGTPPRWLAEHWRDVAHAFAVRELGDMPFPFKPSQLPYGANCAFRADVQRRYLYDPSLGRRPGVSLGGEEVQVMQQMIADGLIGWWVPEARVQHWIPRHRQSLRHLRQFFAGYGEIRGRRLPASDGPRLFGRPRWLWRRALMAEARFWRIRATSAPEVWLTERKETAKAWGELRGAP